ncbi:hypothetical protein LJC07_00835 [Christensenellaceae bacterium OttesenSCG-928-L17]|nr:hypothetical protein [Christensenellaceae bacterium OttesenSCG-928-L17]
MHAEKETASKYFYIVHGVIPEVMAPVAYRRERHARQAGRKMLKCPHCEKRLTDIDEGVCVELYRHPVHVEVKCEFYLRCFYCKSEVGINLT